MWFDFTNRNACQSLLLSSVGFWKVKPTFAPDNLPRQIFLSHFCKYNNFACPPILQNTGYMHAWDGWYCGRKCDRSGNVWLKIHIHACSQRVNMLMFAWFLVVNCCFVKPVFMKWFACIYCRQVSVQSGECGWTKNLGKSNSSGTGNHRAQEGWSTSKFQTGDNDDVYAGWICKQQGTLGVPLFLCFILIRDGLRFAIVKCMICDKHNVRIVYVICSFSDVFPCASGIGAEVLLPTLRTTSSDGWRWHRRHQKPGAASTGQDGDIKSAFPWRTCWRWFALRLQLYFNSFRIEKIYITLHVVTCIFDCYLRICLWHDVLPYAFASNMSSSLIMHVFVEFFL